MLKLEDYIADWPDMDYPNFSAWFAAGQERWPDRVAIRYRLAGAREFDVWTYRRLGNEAKGFARALLASGCRKGDRVVLWSENRPEWCAVWLGAVLAGCTVVPVDFLVQEADAVAIAARVDARAVVISSRKKDALPDFKAACRKAGLAVAFGDEYRKAVDSADPSVALPAPESIAPDDPASIIFTSGTTGVAKGVTLSHRGIIANANASILSLPIWDWDVFMDVLPLHHTYPTTCVFISPLSVGASLTMCEKVVGKVIVDDIRDSGGTIVIGVPLLFDKLKAGLEQGFKAKGAFVSGLLGCMRSLSRFARVSLRWRGFGAALWKGVRAQAGMGTIRLLVAGGGALDPATADFFDDLGFYIVQGYGMSENGPLITTNTMKHKDNRSAGLVVKYTDLKIVDAEPDGVGEIVVRSPSLMLGYYGDDKATKAAFTDDGFLRTGDLGFVDDRGFVFITGRKKNVIVTAGGKNVYPEELEARFGGSRVVKEVLVMGKKGPKGEEVVAVCVPDIEALKADNPGVELDDARVAALVKDEVTRVNRLLAPYQRIAETGVRRADFEQTSSRKIKRFLYKDFDAATRGD